MFEKQTHHFISADQKTCIAAYLYTDSDIAPRATVQLVHGMAEYIGRYDDFARFLVQNGFVVLGHDHLGHGASAASPQDLGFFAEKDAPHLLVEDVRQAGELLQERFPGLPRILFGHSMGSIVARNYLPAYGASLAGCILCGTVGPLKLRRLSCALARREVKRLGSRTVSRFLIKMAFGSYNKRIADAASKNAWLNRDEQAVAAYDADPLCGFPFTSSAMAAVVEMTAAISAPGWAPSLPKDTPLLFIAGEEDPCGGYGRGVREIHRRVQAAGVRRADLKLYAGARHEILNERNREEVYRDVLTWCNSVL